MPTPTFIPSTSPSLLSRPPAANPLCGRRLRVHSPRSPLRRVCACASPAAPGLASGALSPRAQALLNAYIAAPLYEAPSSEDRGETAAILAGKAVGPALFTAAFPSFVSAARGQIERDYPGICEPGGALHPAHRAEACWRDLGQFLALAGGVAFRGGAVRKAALATLRELYAELSVPLPAMCTGLRVLAAQVRAGGHPETGAAALEEVAAGLN